ncbi:MAG: RNA methyltransferase [Phycisphaeraceae bacterium]|nr:RNA methyltransferase [Phycisphaeraceae bacterium]
MNQAWPVISSGANPRVKAVAKLWQSRQRREEGLFVAEGWRQVTRAAEAGLVLRELYGCGEMGAMDSPRFADLAKHAGDTFDVSTIALAKMSYRENPEGILGVFVQPRWTVEDILGTPTLCCAEHGACLVLMAVGIEKPGNLGAMARTAAAAGASGLFVADGVCDPFNPNAITAGTGAVFTLPIAAADGTTLRTILRQRGIRMVLTTPGAKKHWHDIDYRGPTAIVIGAEDQGLGDDWLAETDGVEQVSVTMAGSGVDSLNASVCAGVVLFEAVRQRAAGLS